MVPGNFPGGQANPALCWRYHKQLMESRWWSKMLEIGRITTNTKVKLVVGQMRNGTMWQKWQKFS